LERDIKKLRNTMMNDDVTVYDKAKYHFEGDYPSDLSDDAACTHCGMYLAWLSDKHLLAPWFEEDFKAELVQLRQRQVTPARFFGIVDGALVSDMLNEQGNAFSTAYYLSNQYFSDYDRLLASTLPSTYHVADTWENFEKLRSQIDERYEEWCRDRECD
jgi:hypothetical protein